MTLLAHVSDLHFGREDATLVRALLDALHRAAPNLIVVSGDLTQRAKKKQFRAARAFLEELPKVPQIIVPGNHDVSATNLFERAVRPLKRYKRFVTHDLTPFYADQNVAIAGLNTVRLLNTKDGRLNRQQVQAACKQFSGVAAPAVRVIVTHHPIDLPGSDRIHPTLTRAAMAMEAFAACRVDLFLSGHLHAGLSLTTAARYRLRGYSAVVVHAGTAVSTRTRREPNGWNLIRLGPGAIEIEQMVWGGESFNGAASSKYLHTPDGWQLRH